MKSGQLVASARKPTWGGARAGAGRPAGGAIASEPHKRRPALSARHPIHVTARYLRASTRSLGLATIYRVLRRALTVSLARANFRVVHIAIVRSRLELVVEADDKLALARGMQGFQVSTAKALNRAAHRRGTVFPDRYRMRVLTTRADVRDTIHRLPLARTDAWPQTWLLALEVATPQRHTSLAAGSSRRWFRSRAAEDS